MRLGNAQTSLALHSTFTIFAPVDILDNDIKFVAGVGEARAKLLERELGIRTLGDMLSHYPFRYIDRTRVYRISEITDAAGLSYVQFRARVTGVAYAGTGRKRRFTAFVQDPTGSAELVWFQGVKWIEKRIEVGREYLVFGRPSFYRGELSMAHPELETMEQALSRKAESGMQGIYPSTEKLGNVLGAKGMYQIICNAWAILYTVRDIQYGFYPATSLLACGAAVGTVTLSALAACFSTLAAVPAELMRPAAPLQGKKILLERIRPIWKHLNFSQK